MGKVHGNNPQGVNEQTPQGDGKLLTNSRPSSVASAKGALVKNGQERMEDRNQKELGGAASSGEEQGQVKSEEVKQVVPPAAEGVSESRPERHPTPVLNGDGVKTVGLDTDVDSASGRRSGEAGGKSYESEVKTSPSRDSQQNGGKFEGGGEVGETRNLKSELGEGGQENVPQTEADTNVSVGDGPPSQRDRPTSVNKAREQTLDGIVDDNAKRVGSGSSRKEKQSSPATSSGVLNAGNDEAKVVPKEPAGKEKELCDMVRNSIQQLKQMKAYDNSETLDLVKGISQAYWKGTSHRQAIAQVLCEDGFPALATHALKTLNSMGIFKNDNIWFPSYYFLNTVWNFSDCSPEFATDIADVGMLDLLVANISHKPYLDNLSSKNVTYIVKSSLSIMHNVARAPATTPAFKDLRAEEALIPFANGTTDNEFLQALAVLTLAHITDDMSNLVEIGSGNTGVIGFIVDCMKKALNSGKRRFRGFMASELAEGLARLAAQDSAKSKIIQAGALAVFTDMLKSPDVKEQQASAQAIWALSFDEEARNAVNANTELMKNLEELMKSPDENVKVNCLGALWILKSKLAERSESRRALIKRQTTLELAKDVKDRLIFISYSWADKKKVRKIAAKLKELGYNIWIDTEQMKENILQAMAQGIEDSCVFLMCMSESYKESPNARTEAEYAYKLKKPIIPLMMEKRYQPDGWLGIILGTKLYFNFSGKIPFDEVFDKFLKEIHNMGGEGEQSSVIIHGDSSQSTALPVAKQPTKQVNAYAEIRRWKNEDVLRWLEENNLTSCQSKFAGFDGSHWCGLLQMRKEAPQFYYQSCEQRLGLNFLEILKLSDAISNFMKANNL